jgi:hypothetical protein
MTATERAVGRAFARFLTAVLCLDHDVRDGRLTRRSADAQLRALADELVVDLGQRHGTAGRAAMLARLDPHIREDTRRLVAAHGAPGEEL